MVLIAPARVNVNAPGRAWARLGASANRSAGEAPSDREKQYEDISKAAPKEELTALVCFPACAASIMVVGPTGFKWQFESRLPPLGHLQLRGDALVGVHPRSWPMVLEFRFRDVARPSPPRRR